MKKDVKQIRQGEKGFLIDDGFIQYPRAMMHILPECPPDIRETIRLAASKGWLKTSAYLYGKEQTMDALR